MRRCLYKDGCFFLDGLCIRRWVLTCALITRVGRAIRISRRFSSFLLRLLAVVRRFRLSLVMYRLLIDFILQRVSGCQNEAAGTGSAMGGGQLRRS